MNYLYPIIGSVFFICFPVLSMRLSALAGLIWYLYSITHGYHY
jgi:hypothetical protein